MCAGEYSRTTSKGGKRMRSTRKTLGVAAAVMTVAALAFGVSTASARQAPSGGTTQMNPAAPATEEGPGPQFAPGLEEAEGQPVNRPRPGFKNGKFPKKPLDASTITSATIAASTTSASFNGLNFRDQRLANGGNQFSVEPPDQGLCVGNGFVVEPVNTVVRVYSTAGAPLTGVQDL